MARKESLSHQKIVQRIARAELRGGASKVSVSGIQNPDLASWIANRERHFKDGRVILNPTQEEDLLVY